MTAPGADGQQGLLGRLMVVVRTEFRSQTLIFEPEDPVFGGGPAGWPVANAMPAGTGCA